VAEKLRTEPLRLPGIGPDLRVVTSDS